MSDYDRGYDEGFARGVELTKRQYENRGPRTPSKALYEEAAQRDVKLERCTACDHAQWLHSSNKPDSPCVYVECKCPGFGMTPEQVAAKAEQKELDELLDGLAGVNDEHPADRWRRDAEGTLTQPRNLRPLKYDPNTALIEEELRKWKQETIDRVMRTARGETAP